MVSVVDAIPSENIPGCGKHVDTASTRWAKGEWIREEYYCDFGTQVKADGIYWTAINGKKDSEITKKTFLTDSSRMYQFRVGAFWGTGASDCYAFLDDVYFDNTQARVEIGNNAIFANCTHREIQVPTTWSASSIQISFNKGSFASGTKVYLFVVDASGNASNGFGITVGSSVAGGGAPPTTPGGLTATPITP